MNPQQLPLTPFIGALQAQAEAELLAAIRNLAGAPDASVSLRRTTPPTTQEPTVCLLRQGQALLGLRLRVAEGPWQLGALCLSVMREVDGRRAAEQPQARAWLRQLSRWFEHTPAEERAARGQQLDALHRRWATLRGIEDRDYRHIELAHSGPTAFLRPVFACSQDCHFCWEGRDWPDPPEALVYTWLSELAASGASAITLCGGEPTLFPHLPELVRRCVHEHGMRVHLHSNGVRLRKRGYARALAEAGVSSVLISFHSADAAISDQMTRAPGSWRGTVEGIRRALDSGMAVTLNCVVEQTNVAGLAEHARFIRDQFVRACPDNPVKMVNYSQPGAYYDRLLYLNQICPIDQVRPRLTEAARILDEAGVILELTGSCGFPSCVAADITELVPWRPLSSVDPVHVSARSNAQRVCQSCAAQAHCLGVRDAYVAAWGERGLTPFDQLPSSDWYRRVSAVLGQGWGAPAPALVTPTDAEVDSHLCYLLQRGSVNLGERVGVERLVLMLTRQCELLCSYCLVQIDVHGNEPQMPPTIAAQAIDLLMRSRRPRLELQMFGGEPTRRFPFLVELLDYALEHPDREGRPVSFVLPTNGINLDAAKIEVLQNYPITILLSLDADAVSQMRYRRAKGLDDDAAYQRILNTLELLKRSELHWFMHTVFPPAASADVFARYQWARDHGVPRLQLAYAVGMARSKKREDQYLSGLVEVLRHHHAQPEGLELFTWRNGCEPLILSDELTVDVDGSVVHDGAIFLERGFPAIRQAYYRGHLDRLERFDPLRWSFSQLYDALLSAHEPGSSAHRILSRNAWFGAKVDLTIQRLRDELGRSEPVGRG